MNPSESAVLAEGSAASLIIPVYNVEPFLEECLDSVVAQTVFDRLEVILVEDGSSDRSRELALSYVERFSNISLIEPGHGGLGAARNHGLASATAPFVGFLDSDDILPPDAYELLLDAIESNDDIDLAIGDIETFPLVTDPLWRKDLRGADRVIDSMGEAPSVVHSASACNKLFRRSRLVEFGERFAEGVHFEDAFLVVPFMLEARKIALVTAVVYLYRKRPAGGSIMDSLFVRPQNFWDYLTLLEHLAAHVPRFGRVERELAYGFMVRGFQGFLLRAPEVLPAEDLPDFYRRAYAALEGAQTDTIVRNVAGVRHARPYGLLRAMGETGQFPLGDETDTRLRLYMGAPQIGDFDLGSYDRLLRSGGLTTAIESITKRRNEIVVEGRITAKGLPIDEQPEIALELCLGRRRFPAVWVSRIDRPKADGQWSGFEARVPLKRWPKGEYLPRVRFASEYGSLEMRAFKTAAYFRNSKPFTTGSDHFDFAANTKNQVAVRRSSLASLAGVKSKLSSLRADLKGSDPLDRWRMAARILRRLLRLQGRQVWLIGERWDMAQDNGAALFTHLAENPEAGIVPVYVLERNSAAWADMRKIGRVVPHGSLRHKLALAAASTVISAFDTDTYLIPRDWEKSTYLERFVGPLGTKRVFLQHGVVFRADGNRALHRLASGYDLVVTSTPNENRFFSEQLGYGKRALLSGLPRFDHLIPMRAGTRRQILFAPTWRSGLVVPSYTSKGAPAAGDSFYSSQYFRGIKALLESRELESFLRDVDGELVFLPHYEAASAFAEGLEVSGRVRFADLSERSFQEWLRSSDAYVTDCSSTFFDAAYLGKPIVYFNWDGEAFDVAESFEDSYYDFSEHAYGPLVRSAADLVGALRDAADNDFRPAEKYRERVRSDFGGLERGQSSRIVVNAIKRL